jgi:tetratricopeptide (TPR) repeat protein
MKIELRCIATTIAFFTIICMTGCSWWNKDKQDPFQGSGYRKMLELQKQKAAMLDEDMRTVKKIPEPDAEDMERLGDQYVRQGNSNMAFVYYDKSLQMAPNRNTARYKKGSLFLSKGMIGEAAGEFDTILKNDDQFAYAYEGRGRVALIQGRLEEAKEQFGKALHLNQNLWDVYSFMGIISDRQKRFAEAIGYYHKAIAINPRSATLFNNLGMSYNMAGEYTKALQSYITAVKLDPDNSKIYNNMGIVLGKLGRYNEALDAFKRAGDEASAYNNLGCIYLAEKNYQAAITAFRKAIEINPRFYVKAKENMRYAEALMKAQELD